MPPDARILTSQNGQRFSFDAGTFCLEMLTTGGPGAYQRWEILHRPADLAGWLTDSRLALAAPLAAADLRIRPAELNQIKHLRDTLWRVAPALARGDRASPADLEAINGYAVAPPRPRVDPANRERTWVAPVTGAQVLGAVARDAIELITSGGDRLRECAAADCYLLFLDTSRPGNRRWCSMERCGNRNKVRSHRARRANSA